MKLVLMSTPGFFVEEHKIINLLFDEGLDSIHLRKPNSDINQMRRLLSLISESHHKKIVIHDHLNLIQEYSLKGIHLNPRNPIKSFRKKGTISCTCTSIEDLQYRKKIMDYLILSPLFNNQHKLETFGEEELKVASKRGIIDKKTYALGNIAPNSISFLKSIGFGGAVIYGAIWNYFNQYQSKDFKDLIFQFRHIKKMTD